MTVVGRVMAAGVIVAGSILLGGSAQAAALMRQADSAGQITSPSDGQVVSGASVTISARTELMQLNMGLYVEGPSTPSRKVAGGGANQTISGTFDAGNAPNGTFTVTLKGELTGSKYASSTFKLRRPAEPPGDVNVSLQGTKKVLVTWSKGSEPDLQSYEVSNSQSGIVGRLAADSACAGSSCKAALAVPAKAAGQKVGFTVQAFRGDGDGGSIGSGNSAAAYLTFPANPAAQPKKTTNSQQTPKTKDTKNVDSLPTLPAKKQTLPTSKPTTRKQTTSNLPDMPDTDKNGNLPIPTADDQGGTGGLAPAGTKDSTDSAPVQTSGVRSESPIGDIGQYGLYVAGGLLLLLLGAHAGAWARRRALAAAGGGGAPTSATPVSTAATPLAGGVQVKQTNDSVAPTTTAPRRPAVILAVAKTRVPEKDRAQQQLSSSDEHQPGAASGRSRSVVPDQTRKEVPAALPRSLGTGDVPAVDGARGVDGAQGVNGVLGVDGVRGVAASSGVDDVWGVDEIGDVQEAEVGSTPETQVRRLREVEVRSVRESQVRSVREAEVRTVREVEVFGGPEGREGGSSEGQAGDDREGEGARQGPVRITLPSSAVTDVPASSTSVNPPAAVGIEDRWDDYLPPSPRSMEDSGFWERPQPGSADFWAADDDDDADNERAYAGHPHRNGDS
ncbi:hypothetical protein ACFLIM_19970 [Nonomuraea sp. M3C6]|uniref:Fibronectin type-III domain-containing protein n=1 Tax=Nonomuraea marmarensis TaxID=3351344 RepID=A0ABW7ADQ8_9ACTN